MTVTDEMVKAAKLAVKAEFKKWWSGQSPADDWAEAVARTALTAALSEQVVGWQDISTAPKDANVLVVDRAVVSEAYYNGETDAWWLANTAEHDFDAAHPIYPTLWQPLPAPPPASPAGEGK